MRSIKDLLQTLQLVQAIPHNFIATTTTEATPPVQLYQVTCTQQQQPNPSVKTRPPMPSPNRSTMPQHPLVLEYSSLNVPALVPSTATAATQSPPTCKPLRKEDMATVCRYLHPLRSNWMMLGTFLCVDHSSLEAMETEKYTCDENIVKLVALWLRQISPPPTWQALADAVQYFDQSKADEIRREQSHLMPSMYTSH